MEERDKIKTNLNLVAVSVYFLFILFNSHASMHIKWSDYVGGFCIYLFELITQHISRNVWKKMISCVLFPGVSMHNTSGLPSTPASVNGMHPYCFLAFTRTHTDTGFPFFVYSIISKCRKYQCSPQSPVLKNS